MTEWLAQTHVNAPYIDNSSVLTVGFVLQIFAVVVLVWKVAILNTELQLRLHRLEYDLDNLAQKIREIFLKIELQNDMLNLYKKKMNDIICEVRTTDEDCDIDQL